jgi:hypothetical protein
MRPLLALIALSLSASPAIAQVLSSGGPGNGACGACGAAISGTGSPPSIDLNDLVYGLELQENELAAYRNH